LARFDPFASQAIRGCCAGYVRGKYRDMMLTMTVVHSNDAFHSRMFDFMSANHLTESAN
jgi:hypothetical protein